MQKPRRFSAAEMLIFTSPEERRTLNDLANIFPLFDDLIKTLCVTNPSLLDLRNVALSLLSLYSCSPGAFSMNGNRFSPKKLRPLDEEEMIAPLSEALRSKSRAFRIIGKRTVRKDAAADRVWFLTGALQFVIDDGGGPFKGAADIIYRAQTCEQSQAAMTFIHVVVTMAAKCLASDLALSSSRRR